jgi:hypothetical protein
VRDVLQRVLDRVREGVHRVHTPLVAGVVVGGVADAVDRRVAQVDVGRAHVDPGPQDVGAVGELAGPHALEEIHVVFDAAGAEGRILPRLGQRAAVDAHFLGRLAVDIGVASRNQVFGKLRHPVEIIGGVVEVAFATLFPRAAEPMHRVDDRVDVFLFFLLRVGVVEAQVAAAGEGFGEAEVEEDRLGVAEMQVAVRLGRKAGADLGRIERPGGVVGRAAGVTGPVALRVLAGGEVGLDDVPDEIGGGRRGVGGLAGTAHGGPRFSIAPF